MAVDNNLNSTKCYHNEQIKCYVCDKNTEPKTSKDPSTVLNPAIPNGGYGWVIVFSSFLINLISDGIGFSFGVLYIEFLDYFGESKGKTAWIGALFYAVPLICGPLASLLVDRYGCRKMTILGGVLGCIGFVSSAFSNSLEVLFFTFGIVAGFGLALSYVAAIVIVAFYFDTKRGFATGLSVCGTGIGTFVFAPVITYLIELYTWRGAVLILGGIVLNITVCGATMRDLEWVKEKRKKSTSSSNLSSLQSPTTEQPVVNFLAPECDRLSNSLLQLPTYMSDSKLSAADLPFWAGDKETMKSMVILDRCLKKSISVAHGQPLQVSSYLQNMKMHRHNMTYRAAMLNIHRYELKASSCPDIYQNTDTHKYSGDQKYKLLNELKETIQGLFDPQVFQSLSFMVFCISNFVLYVWYDVPYIYMPDNALVIGISESKASFLISIIGILNTLGTILIGYVGDKGWMNSLLLYSATISVSGIVTFVIPFLIPYWQHCIAAGFFGFFISSNYALTSVIIVDIISLEHFTNAYGLMLLGQGIANLIGPPIGGFLYDLTGNYNATFFGAGIGILISGLMIILIRGATKKKIDPVDDKKLHMYVVDQNTLTLNNATNNSNQQSQQAV